MSDYTNLTDEEFVRRMISRSDLSARETEMLTRLERALDEVHALTLEIEHGDDARRARESRRQAAVAGQGNLVLLPRQ